MEVVLRYVLKVRRGYPRGFERVVAIQRGFGRVAAGMGVVAAVVLASDACATHKQEPGQLAECAPDRLARCVPGLADVDQNPFDGVSVYEPRSDFGAVPPSSARESAPQECQNLPRFGATDSPELDVDYRPATDANGVIVGDRFPKNGAEPVHVRFTVAGAGGDVTREMGAWTHRCPMWGIARTMDDDRVQGWLVAESDEKLKRYQSGAVAWQWPYVTNMAATALPNGVTVQAWYRTTDPSDASRNQLLSQLIGAAGRPRPRSALPPQLADWNQIQISTLLPPLSTDVGINAATADNSAYTSDPGGRFWSLCPSSDRGRTPRYDPLAGWHSFDQSKWDQPGKPPRPTVAISRAHAGDDFRSDLRREIADCTAHLTEKPARCGDRENRQSLQTDSVMTEGEDTVRFTHRWMREVEIRGNSMCGEGVETMRVTQVRGLIVMASASLGGYLFRGDTPPLPLSTLDELLAETVRNIKAA